MDTEVNVKNNKLYTNTYRKKHDRQNFLHINSEHTKSLKNSIPYSQPLRIKQICTKLKDFEHHYKELKQRFLEQGTTQSYWTSTLKQLRNLIGTSL